MIHPTADVSFGKTSKDRANTWFKYQIVNEVTDETVGYITKQTDQSMLEVVQSFLKIRIPCVAMCLNIL